MNNVLLYAMSYVLEDLTGNNVNFASFVLAFLGIGKYNIQLFYY